MNRRSEKLDKFIGKKVTITFWDGDVETGVLHFGKPLFSGLLPSQMYSIDTGVGQSFFRKSHVKKIREEA